MLPIAAITQNGNAASELFRDCYVADDILMPPAIAVDCFSATPAAFLRVIRY